MTLSEVTRKLCAVTKEGPLSQWVDRMGVIAEKIGLDLTCICWQGDPAAVAFSIYQEAERHSKLPKLIEEVSRGNSV